MLCYDLFATVKELSYLVVNLYCECLLHAAG